MNLLRKLALIAITLVSSSCATKQQDLHEPLSLEFDNSLNQCITITGHTLFKSKTPYPFSWLEIQYNLQQSVAHCGCKFAQAHIRIARQDNELSSAAANFQDNNTFIVPVRTQAVMMGESPIKISLTCPQPE
ncbi:hypothetical protein CW740_11390 [Kangiella profundi]|uniref:Lipoprotein n=1 Tax=Kangiella profundi TaxID=1561924 RepID=A0A2K9AEH0_9GAMM|nr:DUF2195 family protein [Kangiella profundi]AUD79817.1 hypothetical protein CW740_11390 [Kangiella profundi]